MNLPFAFAPSNSLIALFASWAVSYVTYAMPSERPARSYVSDRFNTGPIRLKRSCRSCKNHCIVYGYTVTYVQILLRQVIMQVLDAQFCTGRVAGKRSAPYEL
jgi:hypothetical protein